MVGVIGPPLGDTLSLRASEWAEGFGEDILSVLPSGSEVHFGPPFYGMLGADSVGFYVRFLSGTHGYVAIYLEFPFGVRARTEEAFTTLRNVVQEAVLTKLGTLDTTATRH